MGESYGESLLLMFKNTSKFCLPADKWKIIGRRSVARIEKNPEILEQHRAIFRNMLVKFRAHTAKFEPARLVKFANEELWRLYGTYYSLFLEVYPWGEPLPYAIRDEIADKLEKYLRGVLKKSGEENRFGEFYSLLNTPKEKPFTAMEEEGILKIILEIEGDRDALKLFKNADGAPDIARQLDKFPKIRDRIRRHAKEFAWVPYDYGGICDPWDEGHFISVLREMVKGYFNARRRLDDLRDYYDTIGSRQEQLFEKLRIDSHHRMLFRATQESTFMVDNKKEEFSKLNLQLRNLEIEIGRRLNLSLKQVQFLTLEEAEAALTKSQTINHQIINERIEGCILHSKGGKYRVIQGKEIAKFLEKEGLNVKIEQVIELKGVCACGGAAIGKARIIRKASDIGKLKYGEILITAMTTPEFVVGMKKAAAVVTNEGGITSHAAIVSRELNIPCVIGTKISTEVFRDGDILEVKASHGIVRRVVK